MKLTKPQAEVIRDLILAHMSPGSCLDPGVFWAERDAQNNGRRRAFRSLVRQGLVKQPDYLRPYGGYKLTQELFDAYNRWWRAKGWRIHECHPCLP